MSSQLHSPAVLLQGHGLLYAFNRQGSLHMVAKGTFLLLLRIKLLSPSSELFMLLAVFISVISSQLLIEILLLSNSAFMLLPCYAESLLPV
jgi:hypothetical protein